MRNIQEQDFIKHVKMIAKEWHLPTAHIEAFIKQCYNANFTVYQCVVAWREECERREPPP